MKLLIWNLFLALVWAALDGQFQTGDLIFGFVLGYIVLWLLQPIVGKSSYFLKLFQVIGLGVYFVWIFILSNLRVAYNVIAPLSRMRPAVIAVPLDEMTESEITILANMISLTPGTLSLDVSNDQKVIYVHTIFVSDIDEFRRAIKMDMARRLLEVIR